MNHLKNRLTEPGRKPGNYPVELETRVYLKNKTNTPLEIISIPVHPDGHKKLGAVWVFRDLTDIIEAEEQLQTVVNA